MAQQASDGLGAVVYLAIFEQYERVGWWAGCMGQLSLCPVGLQWGEAHAALAVVAQYPLYGSLAQRAMTIVK